MNAGVSFSLADRLADLGDIPLARVRSDPPPGQARFEDAVRINTAEEGIYEWLDGTLVEKAMGWEESVLVGVLVQWVRNFLDDNPLGVVTGPDGMMRLFANTVRAPDVAFVSWDRLPGGQIPKEPVPDVVPDLAIEVLRIGNTRREMSRKRREYFQAGVRLVWMVDPRSRTVAVYASAENVTIANEGDTIDGGDILPGLSFDTGALFAKLDQKAP